MKIAPPKKIFFMKLCESPTFPLSDRFMVNPHYKPIKLLSSFLINFQVQCRTKRSVTLLSESRKSRI